MPTVQFIFILFLTKWSLHLNLIKIRKQFSLNQITFSKHLSGLLGKMSFWLERLFDLKVNCFYIYWLCMTILESCKRAVQLTVVQKAIDRLSDWNSIYDLFKEWEIYFYCFFKLKISCHHHHHHRSSIEIFQLNCKFQSGSRPRDYHRPSPEYVWLWYYLAVAEFWRNQLEKRSNWSCRV